MVGPVELESTTLSLRGSCSDQLSYGPLVGATGIEPIFTDNRSVFLPLEEAPIFFSDKPTQEVV